ncbi:MAG: 30S ribosomal protein S20 [Elusimicrobiota bacterium]
MAKLSTGRHTSALKANRQSLRRAARSRALKKKGRAATKAVLAAQEADQAAKLLPPAASAWDKAVKKGSIHWKTAARRKARLAAHVGKLAPKA